MVKCPICQTDNTKPEKKWKYGQFQVEAYICGNCKTQFREYSRSGEYSYMLRLEKGKGYVKV